MGWRPVGLKLIRRMIREIGQDILWASGNGSNYFAFTTANHQHGWWDKRTHEWDWVEGITDQIGHAESCENLFIKWRIGEPINPEDARNRAKGLHETRIRWAKEWVGCRE